MKNLRQLFENYKHKNRALTNKENSDLRDYIENNRTGNPVDLDIALKLYAYANENRYSKADVKLFESYLKSEVKIEIKESAIWSLVIIWRLYDRYEDVVIDFLKLKDTDLVDYSSLRSVAYLCIAEIIFESRNSKIRNAAHERISNFLTGNKVLSTSEFAEYKYFIESIYLKYFRKTFQRGTYSDFNMEELIYYSNNIEKLLKLDRKMEYYQP